ncbi:hypothetical protein BDZ91DRAFT_789366 [Kalaharituber pfeilii]|nr:hypothetical protein BDZ91DRAFT_789366 [Kalaharituber pfeilii]
MPTFEPDLEPLSTAPLPVTIINPSFMSPMAITLGPNMQGTNQFLIFLPQGIELRGILCGWSASIGFETSSDNLSGGLEDQHLYARNAYYSNGNQPPVLNNHPFHEYDTIVIGDTTYDPVPNDVFSAVPGPCNNNQEMANDPTVECLLDDNPNTTGEILSGIVDQRDANTHFASQNDLSILNAESAASQKSQVTFWMTPNIPDNFVPAPPPPEFGIRFEEAANFTAPLHVNAQRTEFSTYGSCVATSSRHT